jgi:hypothetical protein
MHANVRHLAWPLMLDMRQVDGRRTLSGSMGMMVERTVPLRSLIQIDGIISTNMSPTSTRYIYNKFIPALLHVNLTRRRSGD